MANRLERTLAILITGRDVSATKTIRGVNKQLNALNRAGSKAAGNLSRNLQQGAIIAGAAAAGAVGYAVKAAGDFEAQMNTINTIAFATPEALAKVGDEIRQVAKNTGLSLDDLTAAYYDLLSAGVKAADAQSLLKNAVTLGIGGLATTTETVNLLTTAYNAYGLTAAETAKATDMFAQAVADGKVKASEIASTFADVASIAKTSGIGIDQIAASYGFLTAQGVPASEVMTEMQRAIVSLINPSKTLLTAQKALKINFAEEVKKKGLVPALQELRAYSDKTGIPLMKLLGRIEAVKYVLQTTGPQEPGFLAELGKINASSGEAAAQAAQRMTGFNYQVAVLKANVHDAAITIGTDLLPLVAELAKEATDWIAAHQPEIKQFGKDLAAGIREAVTWAQKLDWNAIGVALKGGASGAKAILDAFLSMPPWVQQALVGGFAINKLTGGLATDLGKIAFDVFAGRGSSPANPLWVQGVGLGAGGAPVGAAGRIASLATKVFLIGAAIGVFAELKGILDEQSAANRQMETELTTKTTDFVKGASDAELRNSLKGIQEQEDRLNASWSLEGFAFGLNIDGIRTAVEEQKKLLQDEIASRGRHGKDTFAGDSGQSLVGDFGRHLPIIADHLGSIAGTMTTLQIGLRADFRAAVAALRAASDPAAILAAAAQVTKDVLGGVGGAASTQGIVAELTAKRDAALAAGDKTTADALTKAIRQIEPFVKGRQWQQEQLAQGRKIVESADSQKQKIADLKAIQQQLLDHNRTSAAAQIQQMIELIAAVKGISFPAGAGPGGRGNDPRFIVPLAPTPARPKPLPGGHPMAHASGLLGFTRGKTDLGYAGEAGGEAVAIIRRPKTLKAGTSKVFVTNWPSGSVNGLNGSNGAGSPAPVLRTVGTAPPQGKMLVDALTAIRARAVDAGHLHPAASQVRATLNRDLARGIPMVRIVQLPPVVKVSTNVNVTASDIQKKDVDRHRIVKPHGSRGSVVGVGS